MVPFWPQPLHLWSWSVEGYNSSHFSFSPNSLCSSLWQTRFPRSRPAYLTSWNPEPHDPAGQTHCGDCRMCLMIPALFNPVSLGRLQHDRKFKEASERGVARGWGEGTGAKHSCSFSPSAGRTETGCSGSYEEGDKKPENRELNYR